VLKQKFPLNGAIAYREGASLTDNPFDHHKQRTDWENWRRQFFAEQDRKVGKV